jgi:hypothetical protein
LESYFFGFEKYIQTAITNILMERVDKTQQFDDKGKISDSSKTPQLLRIV